ncbi:MAG: helix-turn-helix domain-containing protein [Bacilli bacterium]|nr:helix-turn-helix domain-containing protein [Bacilli bacterium]
MNLSDNLKRLRKENNLSQEELAEKLGVSRQSVSKWESNSAYPEMDKLIQISNMFNIGIDELLNKDVREVREKVETKNTINKYIDDFLTFMSKSIDMFLNMNFKQKIKFIFEELFIVFILFIAFNIIGSILSSIYYNLFSFVNLNVINVIKNIFDAIYVAITIVFGTVIILHIYKTRYLDYYEIVDKDELIKNDSENKNVNVIPDKREKVIIRDPDHSSSRFITGLLKLLLIMIKCFAAFLFVGGAFTLIGLVICLVCSFLIAKTGLFFFGILLSLLASISIAIIVLSVLFNFIIGHKNKFGLIFISFIISLLILGSGIGCASIGFTKFDFVEDYSVVDEKIIPMRDNYIVHERYDGNELKFVESDNSDLRITISHATNMYSSVDVNDNYINAYAYSNYDNVFEVIRGQLDEINKMKIHNYNRYKVTIYTTKENIEILKNNYNRMTEGE